jgi:hypothetical protein
MRVLCPTGDQLDNYVERTDLRNLHYLMVADFLIPLCFFRPRRVGRSDRALRSYFSLLILALKTQLTVVVDAPDINLGEGGLVHS